LRRAAHEYARQQPAFETAISTFEQIQTPNGVAFRLIWFARNLSWLIPQQVPVAAICQHRTFAEPGVVMRNVSR
jgi:hypothetical protein